MGSFFWAALVYVNLCFSKTTVKVLSKSQYFFCTETLCFFCTQATSQTKAKLPLMEQSLLWAAASVLQVAETAQGLAAPWIKDRLNHSFLSRLSTALQL